MDFVSNFINSIIVLYFVIHFAVRNAIKPLINEKDQIQIKEKEKYLRNLKGINVLNYAEMKMALLLYVNQSKKKKEYKQYEKYVEILNELKSLDCFTEEEYLDKISQLKEHFGV